MVTQTMVGQVNYTGDEWSLHANTCMAETREAYGEAHKHDVWDGGGRELESKLCNWEGRVSITKHTS